MRQTLIHKVTLITIGVVLFISAAAAFTISSLVEVRDATTYLTGDTIVRIKLFRDITTDVTEVLGEAEAFVLAGHDDDRDGMQAGLTHARALEAQLGTVVGEEDDDFDQYQQAELARLRVQQQHLLDRTQQLVAASADRSAAAVQRAVAAIHQLHVDTEELRNETDTVMGRDVAAVTDTVATRTTTTFYGIAGQLGIFVLLAFVMLLLLRRHIMQPITALSAAASAVAQGSLDQVVRVTSRDEIGTLQQAFNDMTVELRQKTQDLERQVAAATTAQIAAETARTATSEQLATIEEQRTVIREMSVPILPLTTTAVVMPLVGVLDSARLQTVQERVLQTLAQTATRHMILDITGVPLVDSQVAQGLLRVIQSARLLGTEVVIVGVRPEVAQTIVGLGIDLDGTVTRSTLQGGIDYALHGH